MKETITKDFEKYPIGSAERVIAHGLYKSSRDKGLSMPFLGITNPRRAFEVAQYAIDSATTERNGKSWKLEVDHDGMLDYRLHWRFSYSREIDGRTCHVSIGNDKITFSVIVSNEMQFGFGINNRKISSYSSNLRTGSYESDNWEYSYLFQSIEGASMDGIIKEHVSLIQKSIGYFRRIHE